MGGLGLQSERLAEKIVHGQRCGSFGSALPETDSSPLKIIGWKMKFPFGARPIFRGFCC